MIHSAITLSLVPEARGGPFVFWDDVAAACGKAAALGFDAVEIFPPGADALRGLSLAPLLQRQNLRLAAVGSGGGWVKHKLSLTDIDAEKRAAAQAFIRGLIDAAGELGAPVIIGSMQGRWADGVDRQTARTYLGDALAALGAHAGKYGVPLLYEPLNRYESNIANTLADGADLLRAAGTTNVKLLADLFHMNIEESDLPEALRATGPNIGHVHLADSSRRPAGAGHTNFAAIGAALRDVTYTGYISAECLPLPDSDAAATMTMHAFNTFFK